MFWEFGDYADAYRTAARRLAPPPIFDELFEAHLALPTVFLYRHALELALKDAVVWTEITIAEFSPPAAIRSIDETRQQIQGHRLSPLLDRLRSRYASIDASLEPPPFGDLDRAVRAAVAKAEAIDADGQRLRYPYLARSVERSWTPERRAPSPSEVSGLATRMESALEHLLEGLGPWFDDTLERSVEEAWLAQLWEAEKRTRAVERLTLSDRAEQMKGDPEIVDDLKAEISADLLDRD